MVFKDEQLLVEAYNNIVSEAKKKKHNKPDYLDVDKDGNKKEPMKKALKDKTKHSLKKEGLSFKDLYKLVISETSSTIEKN